MAKVSPSTARTPSSRKEKIQKTKGIADRRENRHWWNHEPKKRTGVRFCERCAAVYYDGHWHTSPRMSAYLKESTKSPKMDVCTACKWVIHGRNVSKTAWEGELTLDGLINPAEKAEIIANIRNTAARATKRDPEDFIIAIDDRGDRVVVTTSENQMAVTLGKMIDSAFKGGKLRITWSSDDLPARVHWMHKSS